MANVDVRRISVWRIRDDQHRRTHHRFILRDPADGRRRAGPRQPRDRPIIGDDFPGMIDSRDDLGLADLPGDGADQLDPG